MNVDAFSALPEDPMKHILGYVSEPRALMACERACTRFQRILSDDSVWRHCKGADGERGNSCREKAFIQTVLGDIKEEQRQSRRFLNLSPERVRRMFNADLTRMIIQSAGGYSPPWDVLFDIRGDALGLALDIVEDRILATLQQTNLTAIHATRRSHDYPEVSTSDLQLVKRIHFWDTDPHAAYHCVWGMSASGDLLRAHIDGAIIREWDEAERYRLVRCLANRAGIVKISNAAMLTVFRDIIRWLVVLLRKPMVHHETQLWQKQVRFDSTESIDLWSDIPPAIRTVGESGGLEEVHCVIVPDQIADAAKDVGLPAYGDRRGWALSENQTLEEATNTAKERYLIRIYAEGDMSISSNDSEFNSLSETDEDSDEYSEYDDDECPDGKLLPYAWE